MTDYAIRVEGLCKEYVIGGREKDDRTFREAITDGIAAPLRRLRAIGQEPLPEERFWALKDVSFDVKPGEVIGIIGRNGAGKSTLLKILSRITAPTKGRVEIRGRVASLLEVGTGFHPELTGRENIYLNGAILGMSRAEITRKFDEIVDFSGVDKFLDTPVKRYSSGMYVRLAFAVAAHLEPEILIVDEVLAVGDMQFQKKCLGKMSLVANEGRTVVFVSHNTTALQELCNTAIWIEQGARKKIGTVGDVVTSYILHNTSFTASEVKLFDRPRVGRSSNALRLNHFGFISPLPLSHGSEVMGYVTFSLDRPLQEVALGIGFSTLDGRRLLTYDSDLQAKGRYSCSVPGVYKANFRIDRLPLGPNVYTVDVGCRIGDGHGDYVPRAVLIDIVPGKMTPSFLRHYEPSVRLGSDWQLSGPTLTRSSFAVSPDSAKL
jgi:lipopolysaccharide transport system ATP-binding protein